jgi:GAF domain-containing protein
MTLRTVTDGSDLAQRRRLRTVDSLRMLASSPRKLLDDIAEVASLTTRSDFAAVVLQDDTGFAVIGSHGLRDRAFPVAPRPTGLWPADGIAEDHTPQANGEIAACLSAAIRHDGQIVGMICAASCQPVGSYDPKEREIIARLARVAEAAITSEAALARLAAEAFRALERCRIVSGQAL